MRTIQRLLPFAIVLSLLPSLAHAQDGVRWYSDYQRAQQVAQSQQQLMLLHFYTDWCGPCKRLEKNVFPRSDVADAMVRNFVPVKINATKASALSKQYKINRYPTDVITDAAGRELFRTVTPQEPDRYIALLNQVAAEYRPAAPGMSLASHGQPRNDSSWQQPYPYGPTQASPGMQPRADMAQGRGYPAYNQPAHQASHYAAPQPPHQGGYYDAAAGPHMPSGPGQQYDPRYQAQQPAQGAGYAGHPQQQYQPPSGPSAEPARDPLLASSNPGHSGSYATTGQYAQDRPLRDPAPADGRRQPAPAYGYAPAQDRYASHVPDYRQPPESGQHDAPGAQSGSPPLGLDGFCPVTLAERESWQNGDRQWGALHRGRVYLFTSEDAQRKFLAQPDRFSPVLSGYDPTRYIDRGEVVPGQRKHGMWFRGDMYLFTDEESLSRFSRSPEYYAKKSHEAMMSLGR